MISLNWIPPLKHSVHQNGYCPFGVGGLCSLTWVRKEKICVFSLSCLEEYGIAILGVVFLRTYFGRNVCILGIHNQWHLFVANSHQISSFVWELKVAKIRELSSPFLTLLHYFSLAIICSPKKERVLFIAVCYRVLLNFSHQTSS